MKIIIAVLNEEILDKLLWLLKHFEKKGIEIVKSDENKEYEWSEEYIEKNWKDILMSTQSINLDNDELYEDAEEFYNEKYSN